MQDIFGEQIKNQQEFLQTIIEEKRKALETAPEGRLRCKKTRGRQEYYWVDDRENATGRYILADQKELIKGLAQKSYDRKVLEFAEGEYKRLSALAKYRTAHPLDAICKPYGPKRKELVDPILLSDEEFVEWWLHREKEHPPLGFEKDAPEFYTKKKLRVRSGLIRR